eukprot:6871847-Ditylum_brightwellii.AAC.1
MQQFRPCFGKRFLGGGSMLPIILAHLGHESGVGIKGKLVIMAEYRYTTLLLMVRYRAPLEGILCQQQRGVHFC